MDTTHFKQKIRPFFWVEHEDSASLCLEVGAYKKELFATREEEGFEGNGYDWTSLAQVFLTTKRPDLTEEIQFDPEAGMFCAYSSNPESLKDFATSFKEACENDALIENLFSQAELD